MCFFKYKIHFFSYHKITLENKNRKKIMDFTCSAFTMTLNFSTFLKVMFSFLIFLNIMSLYCYSQLIFLN